MAPSDVQLATMNLMMPIIWALLFMMMSLPRKSVKAFGELQISCRGRFGIAHLAMLLTSIPVRIHAYKWMKDRSADWACRESCILWSFRAVPELHPKCVQESFGLAGCPRARAVHCYEIYQLLPVLLLCYTCFWFVLINFYLNVQNEKYWLIAKGAIVADSYLGKVKTIICFSVAYMLGLLILFATSLPIAIESGYTFGGLITAMILIGMFVMDYFCLLLY
jgi:hypothetical protein